MAVIELDHVTKSYKSRGRRTLANDDVSLRVNEGEVFGLFGHNGAGKTTIVNQLLGLLKPDSGSIVIDGKDMVKDRNQGRYLCSVQPQSKTPLGELTPRSVTRIMGQLRGIGAEEVDRRTTELFEKLDMMQWADVQGTKLSGGILRLTGFCMAAVAPGRAVILDEPTNDVDPVRRRFLWSAIRDLTKDGTSVVVVTHSIREAENAVDTMAVLNEGKVLRQGNVRQIKSETAGNRMKLNAMAKAAEDRFEKPVWGESLKVAEAALTLTFERERASEALKWAAEQRDHGLLAEYSLTEITLEDMYIELVGNKGAVEGAQQ